MLYTLAEEALEHEGEESGPVEGGELIWQALVITGEAAEPCSPGKGSLHHPALGEQDKAAFGFLQFNHNQFNSFSSGLLGGILAGVALGST